MESMLDRYLAGQSTAEEEAQVHKWLEQTADTNNAWAQLKPDEQKEWLAATYAGIQQHITANGKVVRFNWRKWAVAAAILVSLSVGTWYLLLDRKEQPEQGTVTNTVRDKPPGSDKATLVLANGKEILLDTASGKVASEGKVAVFNGAGAVRYQGAEEAMAYNMIRTPRGGQYAVILADGSKVWLNAASSLRFPVSFPGSERKVELTGEAYFDVAHNPKKPFHVLVNNAEVTVLGTEFNINAYAEEPAARTTLLQGRVAVSYQQQNAQLKPGQQAVVQSDQLKVVETDTTAAVAWRKGFFEFDKLDLPSIMRQINRWYDIDVSYEGRTPNISLGGRIGRNLPLSDILTMLKAQGAQFRVEENRIVVLPTP